MRKALLAGVLGVAGSLGAASFGQSIAPAGVPGITVARITPVNQSLIAAYPLNAPPVAGFIPHVVFGLTPEDHPDQNEWFSHIGAPGFNTSLPTAAAPKYFIATYDTGAQSHIITSAAAAAFDLAGNNLEGTVEQTLIGVNGFESGTASDALGIYMTGFSGVAGTAGGNITILPGSLRGQYNTSIVVLDDPNSALPNIIGTPMTAMYQTRIFNSQTRHLTVGTETFKSPEVSFVQQGTPIPAGYSRLTLSAVPSGGFTDPPVFLPDLLTFGHDNPTTPTFWASLLANATAAHNGATLSTQFLFDTGAQVSVLSEDSANDLGIFLEGPDATPPDFLVDIAGVGGTTVQKPGYIIDELRFTTSTGVFTFTDTPIVVTNLPDPRDPLGSVLPGLIGMNLFSDRDLIIDTSPLAGEPPRRVYIGPQLTPEWTTDDDGLWSPDANWMLGSPQEADAPANFLSGITAPRTITVDGDFTAGSIKFDNDHRYTLAGTGQLTLEKFIGVTSIEVLSGSHTIAVPVTLNNNAIVTIAQASSVLTISANINATGRAMTKQGPGAIEVQGLSAATLSVNAGMVRVAAKAQANDPAGTSVVTTLSIAAGGQLDLTNNSMVIDYSGSVGTLVDDVRTMLADNRLATTLGTAATRLGYGDNTVLGLPTFAGKSVDPSSVLIKFTFAGDADLDGDVDVADLGALASAWQTAAAWTGGDFDYTGFVDVADLGLLASNWQAGVGASLKPTAGPWAFAEALQSLGLPSASVPEPAAAGLVGLMFAFGTRRRRAF